MKKELDATKKEIEKFIKHYIYDLKIMNVIVKQLLINTMKVDYILNVGVAGSISDSLYKEDNNITFKEFLKISSKMVSKFIIQFLEKIKQKYDIIGLEE